MITKESVLPDNSHEEEANNNVEHLSPTLDILSILGEWLFFFQCFSALYEFSEYQSEGNLLDDFINVFINPFHFESDERFELCKLAIAFPFFTYFISLRFKLLRPQYLIYVLYRFLITVFLFVNVFIAAYIYFVQHWINLYVSIALSVFLCPALYVLIFYYWRSRKDPIHKDDSFLTKFFDLIQKWDEIGTNLDKLDMEEEITNLDLSKSDERYSDLEMSTIDQKANRQCCFCFICEKSLLFRRRFFTILNMCLLLIAEILLWIHLPQILFRYFLITGIAVFEIFFSIIPFLLTFKTIEAKLHTEYNTLFETFSETFAHISDQILTGVLQFIITPICLLYFKLIANASKSSCNMNKYLQYKTFSLHYQSAPWYSFMINIPKDEYKCQSCLGIYDQYLYLQETINYFKDWESNNLQIKPNSSLYSDLINGSLNYITAYDFNYTENASELYQFVKHQDSLHFNFTKHCKRLCLLIDSNSYANPNLYILYDIFFPSNLVLAFTIAIILIIIYLFIKNSRLGFSIFGSMPAIKDIIFLSDITNQTNEEIYIDHVNDEYNNNENIILEDLNIGNNSSENNTNINNTNINNTNINNTNINNKNINNKNINNKNEKNKNVNNQKEVTKSHEYSNKREIFLDENKWVQITSNIPNSCDSDSFSFLYSRQVIYYIDFAISFAIDLFAGISIKYSFLMYFILAVYFCRTIMIWDFLPYQSPMLNFYKIVINSSAVIYCICIILYAKVDTINFNLKSIYYFFFVVIIIFGLIVMYFDKFAPHPKSFDDFTKSDTSKSNIQYLEVQQIGSSETQIMKVEKYEKEFQEAVNDYNNRVNYQTRRIYIIFFVLIGMCFFFWTYNGIKGRLLDRRKLLC